jgi:putative ABC transport system permease protein
MDFVPTKPGAKPQGTAFRIRESARTALGAFRSHPLRSFLTLLGNILSVATLVAVVSLIDGANKYIGDHVANLGADVFVVSQFPLITDVEEFVRAQKRNRKLTWEDYEYLRDGLQLPLRVGAEASASGTVRDEGEKSLEDVTIRGVTANLADIEAEEPVSGRYISEADDNHRSPVAFVGADVVEKFFPNVDPIGRTIRVDGAPYEVVGVASKRGSTFGQSQDNFVYVPLHTFLKEYGSGQGLTIEVQARGTVWVPEAEAEARWLLRARRRLGASEQDNFGIIAASSIMELFKTLTGAVGHAMVGVVAVFMVVGGVVIMNVMLASVTERTLEIGVRRAAGATRFDIRLQFLVESALLSVIGGGLGLLLAAGIVALLAALTPVPAFLNAGAAFMALLVAAAIGLFFGVYPAWQASELSPIEALRCE